MAEAVHHARIDRNDVSGAAETVARTEGIAYRNSFHASAEARGEVLDFRYGVRKAAAEKILVGHGHDCFARARAERRHTVCVRGIKQPRALKIQHRVEPDLAIRLRA